MSMLLPLLMVLSRKKMEDDKAQAVQTKNEWEREDAEHERKRKDKKDERDAEKQAFEQDTKLLELGDQMVEEHEGVSPWTKVASLLQHFAPGAQSAEKAVNESHAKLDQSKSVRSQAMDRLRERYGEKASASAGTETGEDAQIRTKVDELRKQGISDQAITTMLTDWANKTGRTINPANYGLGG